MRCAGVRRRSWTGEFPHVGGRGEGADEDVRVAPVDVEGYAVGGTIALADQLAGTRIDEPVPVGHPALCVEKRPATTVFGVPEIQDAGFEQATHGDRHVP